MDSVFSHHDILMLECFEIDRLSPEGCAAQHQLRNINTLPYVLLLLRFSFSKLSDATKRLLFYFLSNLTKSQHLIFVARDWILHSLRSGRRLTSGLGLNRRLRTLCCFGLWFFTPVEWLAFRGRHGPLFVKNVSNGRHQLSGQYGLQHFE